MVLYIYMFVTNTSKYHHIPHCNPQPISAHVSRSNQTCVIIHENQQATITILYGLYMILLKKLLKNLGLLLLPLLLLLLPLPLFLLLLFVLLPPLVPLNLLFLLLPVLLLSLLLLLHYYFQLLFNRFIFLELIKIILKSELLLTV